MRYNFLDVNPTLFDLEGKPFYGKLVFVAPGTSRTYRNVFDVDDHNLGHLIITNQHGRLSKQIILDGTYDVQYWEFVGTLFDVEDDTQFRLIRTERIIDPSDNITLDVDGMMTFRTVQEMRDFDVAGLSNRTVVLRTGYYENGDHEGLAYVWDENVPATTADDGGYIIKPSSVTGKGRWVAIFPSYINVKWYGVKSASLQSQVTYQSSAMQAAILRSLYMGKTLYLPSTSSYTFYGLDSVSMDVGNADIRLDAGVRLVAKPGTVNSIKCYNLYCDRDDQVFYGDDTDTRTNVSCHEVWTASIGNYGGIDADIVHWNSQVRQISWKDCEFILESVPSNGGMSFENCKLTFAKDEYKFPLADANYTFSRMDFSDQYFKDGLIDYAYMNVSKDCRIDLESFNNATNWFNLMQDWNESSINCQGQRMDSVSVTIDTTLHNVNIGMLVVGAGHNLSINVGHVDGIVFEDAGKSVSLTDVSVGGNNMPTSIHCWNFQAERISITYASAVISATSMNLDRSQFNCSLVTKTFDVSHCDFTGLVTCRTFTAAYCTFGANIYVQFYMDLRVVCINNTIGPQCQMIITSESTEYVNCKAVGCAWTNNTILGRTTFWITMDRTYLHPDDTEHQYVYKDNIGGIQPGQPFMFETPFLKGEISWDQIEQFTGVHVGPTIGDGNYVFRDGTSVVKWSGNPIPQFFLFTIGTQRVSVHMEVSLLGNKMIDGGLHLPYMPSSAGLNWIFDFSTTDRVRYEFNGTDGYIVTSPIEFVSGYMWQFRTCAKEKSADFNEFKKLVTYPMQIGMWICPTQMLEGIYNGSTSLSDNKLVWRAVAVVN